VLGLIFISASALAYRSDTYGFNYPAQYGGGNTIGVTGYATARLMDMGYSPSWTWQAASASIAISNLPSDRIYYFHGHANPGSTLFWDGSNPSYLRAVDISGLSLNNLRFAVFTGCQSAGNDPGDGGSLLVQSTNRGATCALGWNSDILQDASIYYMENFWDYCLNSWMVKDAANGAFWDTFYRWWPDAGAMGSYAWSGNKDIVINPAQ
jgi:hypothetical protein